MLDTRNKQKNSNNDNNDSTHFSFFSALRLFPLFCNVFIVLCFRFPSKRASGSLLYTCSGKLDLLTPGDVVHILDEREYKVLRVNAHSSTVVPERVDQASNGSYSSSCHQRSFMRPSTAISLMPPITQDASVTADKLTQSCLCETPPPLIIPDVDDIATQCPAPDTCSVATQSDFEAEEHTTFKCPRFDSVDHLIQSSEEAKTSANAAFAELCSQVNEVNKQKEKIANLQQRITTLTTENEALLKRTLNLTEDVSSLKSITANNRLEPVMQRMVWLNILELPPLQMPLDKYPEDVPPEYFFHLLNCSPSSTPEVIQENIRCLLQLLNPYKNPSVPPLASQLVPIISYSKTILLDPALLPVYKCCDFFGVLRGQRGYRSCEKCHPFLQSLDDLMDF